MKQSILVVAPHPDDEVLGCGGTIAKAIKNNIAVDVIYLSSGDSHESVREKEAKDVGKYLGLRNQYFMRLKGDSFRFNDKNLYSLIHLFEETKPGFIYINHSEDADSEHRIACQLVVEAQWRYNFSSTKKNRVLGVLFYEIHKPMQHYSIVEDIGDFVSQKEAAMKIYKSQIQKTRIDNGMIGLNAYRGTMNEDCSYAEVFQIKKFDSIIDFVSK